MSEDLQTQTGKPLRETSIGFNLSDTPALDQLLQPIESKRSIVNDAKIRRLYLQASSQQWFAPQKIDFSMEVNMSPEERRVWARFMTIFYTLEKMGLNVICNMMSKAVRHFHSDDASYYLSAQAADEARHVFAAENYLKKLGAPPKYDYTYHVLGQVASMGFYRVENWLFSTLFSENFASCFLRKAKNAKIDPLGAEMCRYLLMDESRHLHFLHIVLPDILDRLSLFGRSYVKASQFFIMKFCSIMSARLDQDASIVGMDRRELLEDVFANMERSYDAFGVTKSFLTFPKIAPLRTA